MSYVFPLPPDASVHAFTASINRRTIKGVVKGKAEAKATFDQAVAQKQQAALFSQQTVEVFKLMLGNVNPGETVTVSVSYISLVTHEGLNDTLRLSFPTYIAPRYGSILANTRDSGQPNSSSVLALEVSVEVNANITSITSPSHPISSQLGSSGPSPGNIYDPTKAHISLSSTTFLDKDIVLIITCKDLDRPRCVVESYTTKDEKTFTDAYALTLVPRFKLPRLPQQEYIFLIDRSCSMGGGKIKTVRSALQILLRSLPNKGTAFNLVSFGSSCSKLWSQSVPYIAGNVEIASSHVDGMKADMGGTEMKNALLAAFTSRSLDTPTSVFILTDGECWDLDAIQTATRSHVDQVKNDTFFMRVFCMGIGNFVSKAMCDGIARAGNGMVVYVGETEKPDRKLMELLRNAQGPPVMDVYLDWGVPCASEEKGEDGFVVVEEQLAKSTYLLQGENHGVSHSHDQIMTTGPSASGIKQSPPQDSMPSIIPGTRCSFFTIVDRRSEPRWGRSTMVQLKGTALGRPISLEVPVTPIEFVKLTGRTSKKSVHLIAARAIIQGLEEQHRTDSVLQMGLEYGLVTSQTSFVAVDKSGTITNPANVEWVQASHEDSDDDMGFGLFDDYDAGPPPASSQLPPSFNIAATPAGSATPSAPHTPHASTSLAKSSLQITGIKTPEPSMLVLSIESLARAQDFDGSYRPIPALCRLLVGKDTLPTLPSRLHTISLNDQTKAQVWCTMLVLALLTAKFADEADVWENFAGKALTWIQDTLSDDPSVDEHPNEGATIVEDTQVAAKASISAAHSA